MLHNQGKNCEAAAQFEKAASFGRYVQGMAPDAARVTVLCAVGDRTLSEEVRSAIFAKADATYAEALDREPNKGNGDASMAIAFYWRGKYAEAWSAVKLARAIGGRLPEPFLRPLREKMPEP